MTTNTNPLKLAPGSRPELRESDAAKTPRLTKAVAAAAQAFSDRRRADGLAA